VDANTAQTAPIDGELRIALDDLHFSLQRALTAASNVERRLEDSPASARLLERIEALIRIWRDPSAMN